MKALSSKLVLLVGLFALVACSDPLQDQPSLQPHEHPLMGMPEGVMAVEPREPAQSLSEAKQLANPMKATPSNIRAGKVGYERYCSHCHGDLGFGWTSVGSSLDPAPGDLVQAIENETDGDVFGVITFGNQLCPPLGPTIDVDRRWQIIHYVRTLESEREGREPFWDQRILRNEEAPQKRASSGR